MDINKETENQIQELQMLEQSIQALLMQKQSFQLELSETENALLEAGKIKEDIYKIVGNIMIKSPAPMIIKELKEKKDLISMRLKSIENQEKVLTEKSENLREKVISKIKS